MSGHVGACRVNTWEPLNKPLNAPAPARRSSTAERRPTVRVVPTPQGLVGPAEIQAKFPSSSALATSLPAGARPDDGPRMGGQPARATGGAFGKSRKALARVEAPGGRYSAPSAPVLTRAPCGGQSGLEWSRASCGIPPGQHPAAGLGTSARGRAARRGGARRRNRGIFRGEAFGLVAPAAGA